jgi:CRP-like cAMP-binding protein
MRRASGNVLAGFTASTFGANDEYDDDAEAAIAANLWRHHRLLPPNSRFKERWDLMILLFVLYNCVYIPMQMAFAIAQATPHLVIDYFIDVMFAFDIGINFRTAFHNEHYEMVFAKREIAKRYLRTWFLVDLLATFPFEIFFIGSADSDTLFVLDILKAPRLLRIARFLKRADKLQGANSLRMLWLFMLFLFLSHATACIWWAIGKSGPVDVYSTSWIERASTSDLEDASLAQKYASSLYWSLTTQLKGKPWVDPDTCLEKVFTLFMVLMGTLVFAMLNANLTAIIQAADQHNKSRRDKMRLLHQFGAREGLPRKLRTRIVRQLHHEWNLSSGIEVGAMLRQFPRSLRGQVLLQIHGNLIQSCDLFTRMSLECAKSLFMVMQPAICLQKEFLIAAGQRCEYLYILERGTLQVKQRSKREEQVTEASIRRASYGESRETHSMKKGRFLMRERPGSCIGLADPFAPLAPYQYAVTATKRATLFKLCGEDLRSILEGFGGEDREEAVKHMQREFADLNAALSTERQTGAVRETHVRDESSPADTAPDVNGRGTLFGSTRGSVMVSSCVSASLQLRREDPSKAAMRSKVEELTDSIASAEKKLEMCAMLFGKIERHMAGVSELRELLNQAASLILPEGEACGPLPGAGRAASAPSASAEEPGLIGRSLNLLAGMLSERTREDVIPPR